MPEVCAVAPLIAQDVIRPAMDAGRAGFLRGV